MWLSLHLDQSLPHWTTSILPVLGKPNQNSFIPASPLWVSEWMHSDGGSFWVCLPWHWLLSLVFAACLLLMFMRHFELCDGLVELQGCVATFVVPLTTKDTTNMAASCVSAHCMVALNDLCWQPSLCCRAFRMAMVSEFLGQLTLNVGVILSDAS